MALMDYKGQLMDGQSMAGSKNATITQYTFDAGAANANIGRGNPIYCHIKIGTAMAGQALTSTLAIVLQHSPATTPASFADLLNVNLGGRSSMTINLCTAGKLIYSGAVPPGGYRYYRLKATIGGTVTSGGTVDAWLDIGPLPTKME